MKAALTDFGKAVASGVVVAVAIVAVLRWWMLHG